MFTKDQRSQLNEISKVLYGVSSRWQTLLNSGAFRVPTESTTVEEKVETVTFAGRSKNGKHGPIMRRAKALAKGLVTEEQVPATRTRNVTQFRDPTFEDVLKVMSTALDARKVGGLSNEDLIQTVALRYSLGTITFPFSLVRGTGEAQADLVKSILERVPEDKRLLVEALIVKDGEEPKDLPLDAFQFISDYVFALNHPAEAKTLSEESLEAVDLNPKTPRIPHAMQRSLQLVENKKGSGTPAHVVAQRRAKNKAARKARRVNRSA